MKKILFIAYHFHPDTAVGAIRTNKYVQYLPTHGWKAHVLTVRTEHLPRIDGRGDDPPCPVTRTSVLPRPDDIYRAVRSRMAIPRPGRPGSGRSLGGGSGGGNPRPVPWIHRFMNTLSNTPDAQIGWYLPAVRAGRRLLRAERFDAIYTSGPPHTCHLIGLRLARWSRLPLIVDFRDPWDAPGAGSPLELEWTQSFNRRMERRTVEEAALIVTTTREWRDRLAARYGPEVGEKCFCILNGFDGEEFPPLRELPLRHEPGPRIFLHGGSLYKGRDPTALLGAVQELLAEGVVSPEAVRFRFLGDFDADVVGAGDFLTKAGLGAVVSFEPGIRREDYLRLSLRSDVLILMQSDSAAVNIPAKAFEYLATGNRVLVLTGEGSTRSLMEGFDHVVLAEIDDKEGIKAAISHLAGLPRDHVLTARSRERISALTKARLAEEFAGLLDQYTGASP